MLASPALLFAAMCGVLARTALGQRWTAGVDDFSPHSRSFRRDRLEYADFLLVAPQLLSQKRAISLTACRPFSVF